MSGTEERLDPEATCGCGHLVKRHLDRAGVLGAGKCVACMGDSWCGGPRAVTPKRLSVSEATIIVDTLVLGAFIRSTDSAAAISHLLTRSGTFPTVDALLDYACGPRAEVREDPSFTPMPIMQVPVGQPDTGDGTLVNAYGDTMDQAMENAHRAAIDPGFRLQVNATGADFEAWLNRQPKGPWRRLLDAVNEHRRRERGPRD